MIYKYTENDKSSAIYSIADVDMFPLHTPYAEGIFAHFQAVFITGNPAEIALIKSFLDVEDILYFFHGEHFYRIFFTHPVILMVEDENAQSVRDLIEDLELV